MTLSKARLKRAIMHACAGHGVGTATANNIAEAAAAFVRTAERHIENAEKEERAAKSKTKAPKRG